MAIKDFTIPSQDSIEYHLKNDVNILDAVIKLTISKHFPLTSVSFNEKHVPVSNFGSFPDNFVIKSF